MTDSGGAKWPQVVHFYVSVTIQLWMRFHGGGMLPDLFSNSLAYLGPIPTLYLVCRHGVRQMSA